jgi:hypothetical protein
MVPKRFVRQSPAPDGSAPTFMAETDQPQIVFSQRLISPQFVWLRLKRFEPTCSLQVCFSLNSRAVGLTAESGFNAGLEITQIVRKIWTMGSFYLSVGKKFTFYYRSLTRFATRLVARWLR